MRYILIVCIGLFLMTACTSEEESPEESEEQIASYISPPSISFSGNDARNQLMADKHCWAPSGEKCEVSPSDPSEVVLGIRTRIYQPSKEVNMSFRLVDDPRIGNPDEINIMYYSASDELVETHSETLTFGDTFQLLETEGRYNIVAQLIWDDEIYGESYQVLPVLIRE
ncbi:hypothetical protein [Alkalibacillus haloalkaliphilus]|uniref:Lipoprotein n=1 Tax=Alkalibacillus haloalkaliphilus TaxID=94136 RepID=A0A511W490_9BACI|nr:hypothetical protein [Alkalibacillus haloalkaliphilus]GEN44853.1 hypothetical protein AHA02nite_06290 [Alkalibacillus haloalkaliphilus]